MVAQDLCAVRGDSGDSNVSDREITSPLSLRAAQLFAFTNLREILNSKNSTPHKLQIC
jgi:hypothetical protein